MARFVVAPDGWSRRRERERMLHAAGQASCPLEIAPGRAGLAWGGCIVVRSRRQNGLRRSRGADSLRFRRIAGIARRGRVDAGCAPDAGAGASARSGRFSASPGASGRASFNIPLSFSRTCRVAEDISLTLSGAGAATTSGFAAAFCASVAAMRSCSAAWTG